MSTLNIAVLQLLRRIGLLLRDLCWLLFMYRCRQDIPVLGDVPFLLAFYLSRIIVDGFRLQILIVVASVPDAVAVEVHQCTDIILVRLYIFEGSHFFL